MKQYRRIFLLCALVLSFSHDIFAQKKLTLSAVAGVPPVATVGAVLEYAYRQLGLEVVVVEYPGLRGLLYANTGKCDGVAFRIAGIEKDYNNLIPITIPVRKDNMNIFVTQENKFDVEGWSSIPRKYVIGYRRGLLFVQDAAEKHGLKVEPVNDTEQLFRKLKAGRNDAIIVGALIGAQYIQLPQYKEVIMLPDPIQTNYLYHYLHVKHENLVPKITAVLQEMERNGTIQKIRKQIEEKHHD